ncbi:histidine kinase [Streptomyces sp. AM 2-1-1]|uniref:sensor histidine kinase n=1 Tax=Streptomyces sp. AM 2-1-1 TaxID=3028709 RepID=UPI0023B9F341|nr:histidine kinase [Streptomyces sp. AM 2-1-1]WEH39066.1 histidine kinase [Streptomyces sp. AM 2-1-1]
MTQGDVRGRRPQARRTAATGTQQWAAVSSAAPSPAIASVLLGVVFLGYLLMQMVNIFEVSPGNGELVCSLAVPPLLVTLQYVHSAPRAQALRRRVAPWSLIAQAVLTFVPLTAFGWHWGGMAGFLAGSLLLSLTPRTGWTMYGLTVAAVVLVSARQDLGFVNVVYMGVSTALTGLVLFSLARLAALSAAIHESRDELARMAVARERLRFARDLHDLLGYSLSSITLKNELISRLIDHNPERAREEVAEVLLISRQALADVREVARGYRDMSLLVEVESARSVLKAAGIDARVDIACGKLSATAHTILATVLREGVTNLLRHSQPRTCSITTKTEEQAGRGQPAQVVLTLVNDGVGTGSFVSAGSAPTGTGLGNLAVRVSAVGGRLKAGTVEEGVFQLSVRVPVDAEPAPSGDPMPAPAARVPV